MAVEFGVNPLGLGPGKSSIVFYFAMRIERLEGGGVVYCLADELPR